MFENLNKERKNTLGIKMDENAKFVKLGEWVKEHPNTDRIVVHGFLITNGGNYGKSIAVTPDKDTFVTLPKRYVDVFEKLTPDQIDGVLAGKMVLKDFEYITAKNGNQTWTFTFGDVQ